MNEDRLLSDVKSTLQITWDTDDEAIKDKIIDAKALIESRVGNIDFSGSTITSTLGRKLVREAVRYDWNGYSATFSRDFHDEILNLQIVNGRERMKANNG